MDTKEIFEKIAKQNHTTPEDVRAEIQKAIDVGFADPDPNIQKEWKKMKLKGERPTPEEVIAYVVDCLMN